MTTQAAPRSERYAEAGVDVDRGAALVDLIGPIARGTARPGAVPSLGGFAGLFITHSISEAVFMSTRVHVMSARPGHIVAEHAVPFPYPRDPSLRFEPEFAALSGEISTALRAAHV